MRNLRIFCVVVVFMVPRFSPAFILLNKIHENDVKDHPKGFGTAKHAIIIGTFCNLIAFFSFTLVFFDIVFLIGTIMNKLIPILLPIHERSTNVQAQILSKNVSKTEPRRRCGSFIRGVQELVLKMRLSRHAPTDSGLL